MAEEFVDIEQNGDPLGILSKKTVSPKVQEAAPVDNDPLGILKKKSTPVVSSVTPSPLPSQPDFLKQGQKVASGEIFTDISKSVPKTTVQPVAKPTLKEAALKDRENNGNYLAALYNMVVSGAETIAGGAARLNQKFDASPIARIQETADKAASSVTGINYEAIREKEAADRVRNLVGNVRSGASSKEYEKKLVQGFDVTNGIGLDDIKALGVILPSIAGDMALGVATGGTSFAIQGYDNALSTIDDIPEAKNMSETTRTAFGLGGAVIAGVLEKLGMDNILKSGTATKYVTSKILKEASEELAKKGVKVTAEQFQKTVSDKATQLLTKTALKNTVKAGAKSGLVEGGTEATQEGAMDLMKLAANQIENKKIFDEQEIKNTAASRYLNSAVMGGIFGGIGGAVTARTKNLQRHIESEIKNAKTQQDIDNLVSEINQNVEDGTLSNNDAELLKSMVDENLNKPKDLDIKNEKEAKLSEVNGEIALLNKEDRLYNENLEKLNKRKAEINSYYDNLSKESKKLDEVDAEDGAAIPTEEVVTEEVKPISLEDEYNSKSVDELIALKKKLYPKPDIETPMTSKEKLLDRVIAKKFSEKNQEIIEKRKIAEETPRFPSYDDAQEWIKSKSKEYKSKNDFLASQEYRDALPDINALFKVEKADYSKKAKEAMRESGVKIGDRVVYDYVTPIGVETYSGQILDRKGVPFVRFDNGQKTMSGKQSVRWHKGFIKESAPAAIAESVVEKVKPTEEKLTEKTIPVIDDKGEIEFAYKVPVSDERTFITRKDYEAEIKKAKAEVKPTEVKSVEQLREQEQAELDSKIPNAEQYRVNGKVDRAKLTNEEDIKAFDEVYNKYDKLISPLLEGQKQEAKPIEGIAYHGNTGKISPSNAIYLGDESLAKSYAEETGGDIKRVEYKINNPFVVDSDKKSKIIMDFVDDYKKNNPKSKWHPDTTTYVNEQLKNLGYDGLVIKEKALNTNYGYDTIGSTYGEPQVVLFSNNQVKAEVKPTELKVKEEKTFAQKDLDRAEAKKIHSRVSEMEPPSDAEQVALRYLAEGGKVSQDAINEVSGTTKRASLNTGRRELKTAEAKARDYAGGTESLDDLAHRLWEASGQEISERDIKDALMSEIGNNNTRLDASKAYLEKYNLEYKEEQYYNRLAEERKDDVLREQDELEKQFRKPLDEQIEGEASAEHINNLIKQYEADFERENKQLESEGKGKADKEISGRDGGKEGFKEEYQKIKSNKKKKDFLRNNLPEEFKPLADELTNAQMSEIVDSNFDLKTIKNIQDAVQKQSAAEVLQPKQEGDGGTGGERKRVEQGKQGDEPAGEGKAKAAEEAQPKGAEEGEVIGITHEQLNEVARELDFPEYEASPETVEQWDTEAKERLSKDPEYANKLIAKYEEGKIPTPQEQRAMLVIISSAKAKINANPSPENLAQFKRIMELSNNVGGKLVGQSLRARQGIKQVEDTLPDFLLMRENDRGYPFTESEIKDQARIFEELQKEKNALKEALQKSEEANAKLIAEMGVNKAKAAARKAAKKTREEYVIERKQSLAAAREALKKLRSGEQGLTAVSIPGVKELTAVAPHIKNYMKSLVEEGVSKLDDVINDTYAEFKDIVDGITKKDILDAFNGEYDQSKPRTRNEKAEELRLLQREAALIKELENVRKGIEKEKNPAQKIKKNERILELEDKIKEVKRLNKERDRVSQEFTESEFASKTEDELLASKRKMLTKRIEKLQDDIKNKRYLEEKSAPPKLELDRKTQLLKDRVVKMERQIEAERQKDAYKKMSKTEKAFDHINQITGIRRVMQTAFDLSVSLRQGVLVAFNPRKWDVFSKAFGNQIKSAFSDKKYNSLMYDIHNSSEYNKMLEDGIKFNELDALKNEERNEDFQKSFLYGIKIPVVRQLITEPLLASQRAADGFLNTARYELYLKYEKQLLKQGITRQSDPEAYKKMADLVMNMTGRGKLAGFLESGKANKVVSNTFYGARLMAANINTLNPVKYAKLPPGVRKEVMKDMLSYVTTTAGIMLAASAAGAKVEMDPDEPDFLQIRFGDKVYDITGGKAAYLRTFFRMTSALYSRFTDNKYNQQKKIERAGSSLFKFFRNKLAPNTGYAVNMALGKNTLNQDFDPYEVLEAYPMYADDFAEALKDEGITSLATVLAPNILGIGYGNYANQANKESLETSLERMLNSDEMNPELIKNHKDGGRVINEKEFEELTKLIDAKREKEIRKLYDGKSKFNLTLYKGNVVTKKVENMTGKDVKDMTEQEKAKYMTEDEVKKAKKSIASEATRLSKEQLFGKEKKTREEKMEDKRLSRARKRFD